MLEYLLYRTKVKVEKLCRPLESFSSNCYFIIFVYILLLFHTYFYDNFLVTHETAGRKSQPTIFKLV